MRVLPLVSVLERPVQARLAVHLAAALAHLGAKVLILDASRGEVAAALGLRPRYELLHLLQAEKKFDEVVLEGPDGLRIVPAARGIESMQHADDTGWSELFSAFAGLGQAPDIVLLNSAPGELRAACRAGGGTSEVVLALETHGEAVTAAYAMIKTALRVEGQRAYRLLFAGTASDFHAAPLVERMRAAGQRFLGADLRCGGALRRESVLGLSAPARQTIVTSDPAHPASAAFLALAGASADWCLPEYSRPGAIAAREAHTV